MSLFTKIIGKLDYLSRGVILFGIRPDSENGNKNESSFFCFSNAESFQAYADQITTDYSARFEAGHHICILTQGRTIATYGWINAGDSHQIGELNLWMTLPPNTEILYDFFTLPEFRGKGLYPSLLKNIVNRNRAVKIIYILEANEGSRRGIEKAGFQVLGKITGASKNRYKSLINKI